MTPSDPERNVGLETAKMPSCLAAAIFCPKPPSVSILLGDTRLMGLLRARDPDGEVACSWHGTHATRFFYGIPDAVMVDRCMGELSADLRYHEIPEGHFAGPPPAALARREPQLGTTPKYPTVQPKPSTTSSNASSVARSDSATSAITQSACCSTLTKEAKTSCKSPKRADSQSPKPPRH